jgi:hypothetical protein
VRNGRLPVLWLCGPPGAGKSAAGWALYAGLARSGARAGFIDIDQLGMCVPPSPDDVHRYRLKERNLSAMAGNFRAAGCDALVVAGDLGPSPGLSAGTVPGAILTICHLRVSPGEQRRRLTSRGQGADFIAGALRQAEELGRASFADADLDTDGLAVPEVARLARECCGGWPPERVAGARADDSGPELLTAPGTDGDVLLVCGATGVGKSAAAFDVYLRKLRAGIAAAYLDLDQIGFMSPVPANDPGGHRLKARNLADLWRTFHAAGARCLILSGPVPDKRAAAGYSGALPGARVTVCRLHAGPAELARRISRRGQGLNSWTQPGDPLLNQPEAHLRLAAAESAAEAEALERSDLGDLRIYTDGRTVPEVADLIAQHW